MAKRRKKSSGIETLISMMLLMSEILVNIIFRTIILTVDVITYFTSSYHAKSGISLFTVIFDKGYYGEFIMFRKVASLLGKESVLTNVYLESKNTDFTEVDVLAVTNKAVYVLEVKNYGGYIYGSSKDQHWTQVMHKFSKHKFYNPLRQNYAHQKAVEQYLNLKSDHLMPIIVFSNRSKLSKITVDEHTHVYQYKNALKFIKHHEKNADYLFTDAQKEAFIVKLIAQSKMPNSIKEKHIAQVQKVIETKQNPT